MKSLTLCSLTYSNTPRHALLFTSHWTSWRFCAAGAKRELYLYTRPGLLFAHAADQSPSVAGNLGHVGDRLHLLWIPDAHLHGRLNMRWVTCSHAGPTLPVGVCAAQCLKVFGTINKTHDNWIHSRFIHFLATCSGTFRAGSHLVLQHTSTCTSSNRLRWDLSFPALHANTHVRLSVCKDQTSCF